MGSFRGERGFLVGFRVFVKLKLLICCLGTDSNTTTQQSAQPSNPESPLVSVSRNSQSPVVEPGISCLSTVGTPER